MAKKRKGEGRPHRVAFRISEKLRRAIEHQADKLDCTMGDVVNDVLEKNLNPTKDKSNDQTPQLQP